MWTLLWQSANNLSTSESSSTNWENLRAHPSVFMIISMTHRTGDPGSSKLIRLPARSSRLSFPAARLELRVNDSDPKDRTEYRWLNLISKNYNGAPPLTASFS